MMIRLFAVVAVGVLALAGCSDDPATSAPSPAPMTSVTPTPPSEMIVDGKGYPLTYATCAQKIWDGRVAEWNHLVEERDAKGAAEVVVAGKTYLDSAAYGKAKGWPASFKATLDDPATTKACG
jgi:hypothetical protein